MKKFKLQEIIFLLIGNTLIAFAVANFILPYHLVTGGMASIAIIVNKLFGWNEQLVINIVIISMFILGYFALGKKFAVKTALSTFYYPLALAFFLKYPVVIDTSEILLIAIYAGVLVGVGIGLVFNVGASTGGLDIPPLILNKVFGYQISHMVALIDGITILLGAVIFGAEVIMIGLLSAAITSLMINQLMVLGSAKMLNVMIITEHYDQVVTWIHDTMDRGTTLLEASGGYTGDSRPVVMTVIDKRRLHDLNEGVLFIDPIAFMIIHEVNEVKGRGFTI